MPQQSFDALVLTALSLLYGHIDIFMLYVYFPVTPAVYAIRSRAVIMCERG